MEKLWGKKYIHELDAGFKSSLGGLDPRVDVWNVDENGKKSTWIGALILTRRTGKIREVGNVPDEMKRNLELMLCPKD